MKILLTSCALFAAILTTAQPAKDQPKPVSVKILVDSLDKALDRTYIFPEKSPVMSGYLKAQLKKGVYKDVTDPKALAVKLTLDIQSVHKDPHLRIHYDPRFTARAAEASKQGGPPDLKEAINQAKSDNFEFKKLEILDGNIGYVKFTGFSGFIDEAKPTIGAAFRFLANTNAIIIDLRKNGGGSPWMVKQIASYFVQERTRLNDIYERRNNKTVAFWAEPEAAENLKLSMPLYILTGKGTFSAAEDFTYAMKVNKRAVIVGDTTGGGAHPTGPVDIGQGFVIDIPFARSINHITKTDWEGTGVLPDVPVHSDDALVEAQRLIFKARLSEATSDQEKKQIDWSLNALLAHDYDQTVDTSTFSLWEGQYNNFRISVKQNKLFLHDFHGRTFELKPISTALFLADDWLQVEFISSPEGKVSLKLMGKPGWVDIYERTK